MLVFLLWLSGAALLFLPGLVVLALYKYYSREDKVKPINLTKKTLIMLICPTLFLINIPINIVKYITSCKESGFIINKTVSNVNGFIYNDGVGVDCFFSCGYLLHKMQQAGIGYRYIDAPASNNRDVTTYRYTIEDSRSPLCEDLYEKFRKHKRLSVMVRSFRKQVGLGKDQCIGRQQVSNAEISTYMVSRSNEADGIRDISQWIKVKGWIVTDTKTNTIIASNKRFKFYVNWFYWVFVSKMSPNPVTSCPQTTDIVFGPYKKSERELSLFLIPKILAPPT